MSPDRKTRSGPDEITINLNVKDIKIAAGSLLVGFILGAFCTNQCDDSEAKNPGPNQNNTTISRNEIISPPLTPVVVATSKVVSPPLTPIVSPPLTPIVIERVISPPLTPIVSPPLTPTRGN